MLAGLWVASGPSKRLAVLFGLLGYQSLLIPVLACGPASWSTSAGFGGVGDALIVCLLVALL